MLHLSCSVSCGKVQNTCRRIHKNVPYPISCASEGKHNDHFGTSSLHQQIKMVLEGGNEIFLKLKSFLFILWQWWSGI